MFPASTDPLGPIGTGSDGSDGSDGVDGRGPDDARDLACELTASDAQCSPPPPEPSDISDLDLPDVPDVSAGLGFGTILVVLLAIALIAVIAWLVVSFVKQRSAFDDSDSDDLDESLDERADTRIVDVERPPDRWRRLAAEHRAAGSFRDAVRCEYRALVGDLARAGYVDEIAGRTSGEERAQLASLAPHVSPAFDRAADIFDSSWFDDAEVTSAHDEEFVAASRLVGDQMLSGTASSRGAR